MSVRFALAAVAAAAVTYFSGGNVALGAQTFAFVYGTTGFLDPNKKVLGPKLNDLKAPQASYGSPLPLLEGAPRLAGIFAWSTEKRPVATTQTQGDKGGPGVDTTTWTYEIDCGIVLSGNECAGLRRVFSNGKLVWSVAEDATVRTLQASATSAPWRSITFYSGAADQLPHPTYEAAVGVDNAPAYRGRASVWIDGLDLGSSGQLPVLTFEVFRNGTPSEGAGAVIEDFADAEIYFQDGAINASLLDLGYTESIGNYARGEFSLVGVARGVGVRIGSREGDPFQGDEIRRDVDVGLVHGLVAQFRIDDLNADDAPSLTLYKAGAGVFSFVPRLSVATDATQRPALVLWYLGTPTITILGSTELAVNTWYEVRLSISPNSGESVCEVWRIDGPDTLAATATLSGVILPLDFDQLAWQNSIAAAGTQTSGTTWANVDAFPSRATVEAEDLADVVQRACLRTGQLEASDLDVTALAGIEVRALAISQVVPARQTLETLMTAYLFEFVEGEKLKAVLRGGAPVMTIPYSDLGASNDGAAEPLPRRRVNDIEIAAKVSVKFANVLNDFQDGLEAADRLVTESTAELVIELPLGLTPTEAKRLAVANTMDLAVSLTQIGPITLPAKYAQLEPTDVVMLTAADGSTFRTRIAKVTDGGGIRTMELALDDASAINPDATTDSGYASSSLVLTIASTEAALLDIPPLRDADAGPGTYVAARPTDTTGASWPGYELDRSADGVTYSKLYDSAQRAVMGHAESVLPDFTGGNVYDSASTMTVNVGAAELSSVTFAALLEQANPLLVGAEIVQFKTASLLSPGRYLLSGFLRGRRGTEWATGTHAVGDRVVLLDVAGLSRVVDEQAHVGVPFYYKAVTHRKSLASVVPTLFTNTGVSLKPFAPVDLVVAGDELRWRRRSRLSSRFLAEGVDVPLGEASESYDVEVLDAGDAVLSSSTVSTPSFDLSAPPVGAAKVRVYQRSAAVGRGYPALLEL